MYLVRRRQARAQESPTTPEATLLARVRPRTVLVEEKYRVRQEVSRNPDTTLDDGASGTIKIEVPYDGHHHVTRAALDDVRRWSASHPAPPEPGRGRPATLEGGIGHLVVNGHQDTDLAKVTGRAGRTVALPLLIPFRTADLPADSALVTDRFAFRREINYAPARGRPRVVPVQLKIEVTDPGTVSGQHIQLDRNAISVSQRHTGFQRYLELCIVVQVYIAGRKGWNPPHPLVRRMRLSPPPELSLALSAVEITYKDGEGSGDVAPPPPPPSPARCTTCSSR